MYVESLKLENIKAFESLELDFKRPDDKPLSGMNVFVGGNASGKSTLLKCIAMAVSGPKVADQLLISLEGWVKHEKEKGMIELLGHFDFQNDKILPYDLTRTESNFSEELLFTYNKISKNTQLYETSPLNVLGQRLNSLASSTSDLLDSGWFLGAYGPFRRLTGSSNEAQKFALAGGKLASCLTLFREDAALSGSEAWLKQEYFRTLEDKQNKQKPSSLVEDVTNFLNDGLMPAGFQIEKITVDNVLVSTPNGGQIPMRDLSDGCRGAFALILDIIHNMSLAYRGQSLFKRDAEGRLVVSKPGVILIDELEAHLHPSWQQTICDWLKTRFPKIQFFITTHSPLIAQNADEGGLFVLPLPSEIASGQSVRRLTNEEQERVTLGSADNTLLGEAFGLEYTWSSETELLVEKWKKLAARHNGNGGLNASEKMEYRSMLRKMEIVFNDDPEEARYA